MSDEAAKMYERRSSRYRRHRGSRFGVNTHSRTLAQASRLRLGGRPDPEADHDRDDRCEQWQSADHRCPPAVVGLSTSSCVFSKPEFTQEYSYGCVDSTFQPGSPYLGWSEDRCEQFVEGEVLEAGPAAAPQPHLADTLGHRSGSRAKGMSVAMMVVIRCFCVSAFLRLESFGVSFCAARS
jgi:hypothetical protein